LYSAVVFVPLLTLLVFCAPNLFEKTAGFALAVNQKLVFMLFPLSLLGIVTSWVDTKYFSSIKSYFKLFIYGSLFIAMVWGSVFLVVTNLNKA
jgi:hypothetical protein